MNLRIDDTVFDVSPLTPLTNLKELKLGLLNVTSKDLVDLSGLRTLTSLHVIGHHYSRFPTSLVTYWVDLESDYDFSLFTNLTSLSVRLRSRAKLTFPAWLKKLTLEKGLFATQTSATLRWNGFECRVNVSQ